MAIPGFVQAGAGAYCPTPSGGTVSITGVTIGNFLMIHFISRGGLGTSYSNFVGIENLAGSTGVTELLHQSGVGDPIGSRHSVWVGRATATTCSLTLSNPSYDVFGRIYEFSGVNEGTLISDVCENGAGQYGYDYWTQSSLIDEDVTTNDTDRLALNFIALESSQAVGVFTGQSGGTWTEAVAEYATTDGSDATLQLQMAEMPSAGTIDGGSTTITSTGFGLISTALIPAPSSIELDNCLPDADITTTGWTTTPLYSKINDASDATVIQATAS